MSDPLAKYHWHELKKLFGDYQPKPEMPCFHCYEPEAMEISIAFAQFGAAVHPRLPRGTMPAIDATLTALKPSRQSHCPIQSPKARFSLGTMSSGRTR
jgi:hypothetical protein